MLDIKGDPVTGEVIMVGATAEVRIKAENIPALIATLIMASAFVQSGKEFPPTGKKESPVTFQ